MEGKIEILAAIRDLQTHLEGQIHATNKTIQEFVHSVDSHFVDSKLQPKNSLHTNLGKFGFKTENPHREFEISPVLRSMEMGVPKFDGTDPHGWIFRVEEFFDFHGTPDHMRLRYVSLQMEGRAAAWFEWMKVNNLLTTWPEFVVRLKNQFRSSSYNDPQGLLSKLTQNSTVAEFQSTSKDLRDKEDSELKCSESEPKGEVDDQKNSSTIGRGANGNTGNDSNCKMGANYVVQVEAIEESFALARYHESRLEDHKMAGNEVDDLVDSNAAVEIVENDALLDYVETKVVDNMEAEFAKDSNRLVGDDSKWQFDVDVEEKQIFADSFLSMQIIEVVDALNSRKEDVEEFSSFPQIDLSIPDKGVELTMRCTHHGIIFVVAQRKIILAKRRIIFKLYALKEVYVEYLNLHLEDKVVLKEMGMIRISYHNSS